MELIFSTQTYIQQNINMRLTFFMKGSSGTVIKHISPDFQRCLVFPDKLFLGSQNGQ